MHPSEIRGRQTLLTVVTYVGALALWFLAAGPPREGVARWIGTLVFHLLAAALMRWIWIRPQRPKPAFWAPALFLLAAAVALLGRVSQSGGAG